jgi:hypothetical protein
MKRTLCVVAIAAMAASFPLSQASAQARASDHERSRWDNGGRLNSQLGWQQVNFEADARASELYLDVLRGRVQFDRAEVVFRNGRHMVIDLNNRQRGRGRIQLVRFGDVRNVDRVIVTARARSSDVRIALWRDDMGQQVGWNDRYDNDDWRWRR